LPNGFRRLLVGQCQIEVVLTENIKTQKQKSKHQPLQIGMNLELQNRISLCMVN
jgi:hypothetical protein